MKTLTKSVLSAAIITAMAASSAQAHLSGEFFEDSELTLHLKNYYKSKSQIDKTTGEQKSKDKDKGWAQTVGFDFNSGYFANIIGFDLGAHHVFKLHDNIGSNNVSNSDLFRPGHKKNGKTKGESYGKAFGAVKVNLMDNGVAKIGRMVLDTPLLNSFDADAALPSTVEAFYADYSMYGVTVFGAVAKKSSRATEAGYEDYGVRIDGKLKKRSVKTMGAMYEMDGLKLSAAYAKQKDTVKAFYMDGSSTFNMDDHTFVTVGAQYGKNKATGATKDNEIDRGGIAPDEKDSISWHGLMAEAGYDNITMMVSMVDVGGGKNAGLSDAAVGWGTVGDTTEPEDQTEFNGYNSMMINDFHAANEKSYQVKLGYDFSDMVDGLSASFSYVDGKIGGAKADKADTNEYNIHIDYEVPVLEGVMVSLSHGKYEKKSKAENQVKTTTTQKETRLMVTYDLAIF